MLTDAALRNLKPKSKIYKASDRDGMYVTVSPSGTAHQTGKAGQPCGAGNARAAEEHYTPVFVRLQ